MVRENRNAREWQISNRFDSLEADSESSDSEHSDLDEGYEEPDPPADPPPVLDLLGQNFGQIVPSAQQKINVSNQRQRQQPVSGKTQGTAGHTPRPARKVPAPRVVFFDKRDNAAKAGFRRGQPNSSYFMLIKPMRVLEPDRKKMYAVLEEIGVRLQSYIRPPVSFEDRKLLIWGDQKQANDTKNELEYWVSQSQIAFHTKSFAREFSTIAHGYEADSRRIKKDARIQKFQKSPEKDEVFEYTGYFLWPNDEVHAHELLGSSCEAFDSIRIQCRAHVVFDNQLSVFKISSDNPVAVQSAFKRIEGTVREFVARNHRALTLYLVDPPSPAHIRKDITILNNGQRAGSIKVPVLTGTCLISDELAEWRKESQDLADRNMHKMRVALGKSIERLPYYRGRVRMRVLLGTFTLALFRWPQGTSSISFDNFVTDMTLTGTKGGVVRNLNLAIDAQKIMDHCNRATDVLMPMDNCANGLKGITPVHTARFEFRLPETGSVNLEVEVNKSVGSELYEATRSIWTRQGNSAGFKAQPALLELQTIRLHEGVSWKLQIATDNIVDPSRVTPRMADVARSVKYTPPPAGIKPELSGHRVFTHAWTLPIHSFEQKTGMRYRLSSNCSWIFEIARYDTYGLVSPTDGVLRPGLYGATSSLLPVSTQWSATFWNSSWDTTLGENYALGIGKAAITWEPKLETFFPSREDSTDTEPEVGFLEFLEDLKGVLGILDGMKA